jgi:hypothetical protein
VDGKDGCLYGIQNEAYRVLKFNPVDKSMKLIGPDLGVNKWMCGVLAKNGCIYCSPKCDRDPKMLKINTHDCTVVTFDTERREWCSGVLAPDNCIYYMPLDESSNTNQILRVDPSTDKLSYITVPSKGLFLECVLGKDNCIYGFTFLFFPRSPCDAIRCHGA